MRPRMLRTTTEKAKAMIFTNEEITTILKVLENTEYMIPVVIGLYTGMRKQEILALCWSDISLEENTISVTKRLDSYTGELKAPKSENDVRVIQMSAYLKKFLLELRERQQKDKELAGELWQDNTIYNALTERTETIKDFVNIHRDGVMLTEDDLKYISAVLSKHDIKFSFHKLRHTHITSFLCAD